MKLDKIRFARVIAMISSRLDVDHLSNEFVADLDHLIDIEVEPEKGHSSVSDVNNLMRLMRDGTQRIEAIKVYRTITGAGLKESKDAVEAHWPVAPY